MSTPLVCPKCNQPYTRVQCTYHHVLPKRFFPGSHVKVDLCRECHDKLELRIPLRPRLPRRFYFEVVNNFMGFGRVFDTEEVT